MCTNLKNMEVSNNISIGKVRLALVWDNRRPKKDGLFPVKYRITFLRERVYYSSGVDLSETDWFALSDTRKMSLKEHRDIIYNGYDIIKDHLKELVRADDFTFENLAARLNRGMKNSLISSFTWRIESLAIAGRIGTAEWYTCALKSIQKFSKGDLKLLEITKQWLQKYEAYLLEDGKSPTTVSMYLRALRAIMNEALEQGLIKQAQYPFGKGKFQIQSWTSRKMALSLSQISEVLKYPLTSDYEKRWRDLWFFSYLCNGINISDLLQLRYRNIRNDEVRYYRRKTFRTKPNQKEIAAVILPPMEEIIQKWGNPERNPDNFIFPFLTSQLTPIDERRIIKNVTKSINDIMTEIGKSLGYGNISTYTARHSYATVLKRSGANISYISESLGHSDLKTTENYLASFEKEERLKNAALLTKFEHDEQE